MTKKSKRPAGEIHIIEWTDGTYDWVIYTERLRITLAVDQRPYSTKSSAIRAARKAAKRLGIELED